jgi:CxxC motif-containing protein (DUF1111 family)
MVLSQNGPAREYDSSAIPTERPLAEFTTLCDPGRTDVVAIPDEVLLANLEADRRTKASLGISGRLNRNDNSGTITRFGWKAQVPSLQIFAGEAYHVEQGVSSAVFPQERDGTSGCVFNPIPDGRVDSEIGDVDDITLFSVFMRFQAPPETGPASSSATAGFEVFRSGGCALCHTPTLRTGYSNMDPVRNKPVEPFRFSDPADGPGFADQSSRSINQERALGDEFRTEPLWGLGKRILFPHDGRPSNLIDAIEAHASEGNQQFPASEANAVIRHLTGYSRS